jgi:hypothetical protein
VFCCFVFKIGLAHPALPASDSESVFGFDFDSSQGDLFEVFNRGTLLNQKKLPELQFSNFQKEQSGDGSLCEQFGSQSKYPSCFPGEINHCLHLVLCFPVICFSHFFFKPRHTRRFLTIRQTQETKDNAVWKF